MIERIDKHGKEDNFMFKMAEIKVEEIEVMDIITTSGDETPEYPDAGDNGMGWN